VASRAAQYAVRLAGLLVLFAIACGGESGESGESGLLRARQMLMGTYFDIQVASADEAAAEVAMRAAFAEVARVEELLSEWRETSEISEVNRRAGERPAPVGPELLEVVEQSARLSKLTGGAFDISFAACGGLWSFREGRVPADAALDDCLTRVDYRQVVIQRERSTIYLPREGMRIGIAGIGKGYGVDRAAEVLEAAGFTDYIVDGGGDIRVRGAKPDGDWTVGIQDPHRRDRLWATLAVGHGSIVTSGDYQQFFDRDGVRYHHILDPSTGRPARRSQAVTVLAPSAAEADALATGLFVMGSDDGLALVERLEGVEALFFGPGGEMTHSSGFPELRLLP